MKGIESGKQGKTSSRKVMIGFAVTRCTLALCFRRLPDDGVGLLSFYYENVVHTLKGVWDHIFETCMT